MSALGVHLADQGIALSILADSLRLEDSDIAYVTGSVLDGMGDASSDLDVFLLSSEDGFQRRSEQFANERRLQQERRQFGIVYLRMADREMDVEVHRASKLEEMVAALHKLEPDDVEQMFATYDSLGRFERAEAVEFLHRFRIAQPIANEREFFRLRERFPEAKYLAWNRECNLILVGDIQKGIKRSMSQGDGENAYLKLTRLYDALADAYLFAVGQSLDRWKWRLPKLRTAAPGWLLEIYLDVQLLRRSPSEDLPGFVRRYLDRSADIVRAVREAASGV